MSHKTPIEGFTPGDYLRGELEARGWTQEVFAEILGRSPRLVNEIISAKRAITPETAQAIADAFGTSAELWLNLENAYRLSQLRQRDELVARRAKLYGTVPVREMIRRGWIENSSDLDVLERNVCDFLGTPSIDDEPPIVPHAARKSSPYTEVRSALRAWLVRATQLAQRTDVGPFDQRGLEACLERLRELRRDPIDVSRVPGILSDAGVRLVIVEHLAQTRVDGAAFWLDPESPVIALSLRYDRVDGFWFTLMHELIHIKNGDGRMSPSGVAAIDSNLVGSPSSSDIDQLECERAADAGATEFLVPQTQLERFIASVRPLYSKKRIVQFAESVGVHPGIVVGQLQRRGEIPFSHSREMLEKVRELITNVVLTDGWGRFAAVNQ